MSAAEAASGARTLASRPKRKGVTVLREDDFVPDGVAG